MKSGPKKIDLTPSMRNNSLANGEQKAAVPFGKSNVCPGSSTLINLKYQFILYILLKT